MSRPSPWSYEPKNLTEARARILAANPDEVTRNAVNDWLIATYADPLLRAKEDPPGSGVFFGRVANTSVGVLYVLNPDARRIIVIEIRAIT